MEQKRVWFHIILTTYGAWLPGDPRGFRTRHHREHVDGDYKQPPPKGKYDERHRQSKKLTTYPAVVLPGAYRPVVGIALRDRLQQSGGDVLVISVNGQHLHIQVQLDQVQLDDVDARYPVGDAKRHAWFELRKLGWTSKLWGLRCKIVRIKDYAHQKNVYYYILGHAAEGAWVWSALVQ